MTGKIDKGIEVCSLHPQRKYIFVATSLDEISTWGDTSYALYHDMNINTGVVMSMGFCVTHFISSKQKLIANRSTEAYIFGASYYLLYNIW